MNAATVLLALLAALANGAASVLQRRAALDQAVQGERCGGSRLGQALRRLAGLLRNRLWLAGAAAIGLSAMCQAWALAVGRLSVVQPLLASELLFTLLIGSMLFHHRPGIGTWLSFSMLAVGLALFLGAAAPSAGSDTADPGRWLPVGISVTLLVIVLTATARTLSGAARAAVLGASTAVCFATTAALIKEVTGRITDGVAPLFTSWYLYATCAAGLLSLLLLQSALRAGTLAASQPALTLGDALVSVALGWALFGERIALGTSFLPEALGASLIALGAIGLARSPAVAGGDWDTLADTGPPASADGPDSTLPGTRAPGHEDPPTAGGDGRERE